MIRLNAPEWLLLLPVIGCLLWWLPRLRHPLRVGLLLLLCLLLADPQTRQRGRGLDVWVLSDRSASAAASVEPHLHEWEAILQKTRGRDDRLFFLDYAAEATLRDPAAGVVLTGDREATRTGLAINHALSLLAPHRNARLLLLGDGFSTDTPADSAERLAREGVPLDYRLTAAGTQDDVRVESLSLPMRAQVREAFLIEVRVSGPVGREVPYTLKRDGAVLARGKVTLGYPYGVARFTDRPSEPGGHRYEVALAPEWRDPFPGNNRAAQWMEVTGGPRLLLATLYEDDPLGKVLAAHGFEVQVVRDLSSLSEGHLQGARGVILNNVPAFSLPPAFLNALDFYVRHQGGGLLMAGGKASFGSGGYFGSSIDELLPVSMELRNDHRKFAVALSIVLDRSGSMGAAASGGTKMELAANAAARSVELLGAMDQVSVYAVDTKPHPIVGLSTVGGKQGELAMTVRGITVGGGGIYVGEGLKAARDSLAGSPRGTRHVILFADAADAEEPGSYQARIAGMRKEGMTISVVGLGRETDPDAALLREIAALGEGRIAFTEDAANLPALFEQETVAVARSAFLEEATALKPLATWQEIAARPLAWLPSVDGYNLSYLRPGATAALLSADEEAAPLVAFWQRGSGRVAAVSFPLGGPFSESVRRWPAFGDFTQTLARWLMGDGPEPGYAVRATVEGSELRAELLYDVSREKEIATHPPELLLAGEKPGETRPLVWQRMEPGRFRVEAPLRPGERVRGVVQVGKASLPFGPLLAGNGAEWAFDRARPAEIAALAKASGGEERVDLGSIWSAPRASGYAGWRGWLLALLLGLFLLETLLARLGWKPRALPALAGALPRRIPGKRPARAHAAAPPPPAPEPQEEEKPPAPEEQAGARRSRFRRAKRF